MNERQLRPVFAHDSAGNQFVKSPVLYNQPSTGKQIISFGGYCEYAVSRLMERREVYETHGLCIDMGGRNHFGAPRVVIAAEEMRKVFKQIDEG